MRGATGGEANSRTDGTRLCTEQSLEVEELGLRQPACGSASLVPTARRHRLLMKKDGCTEWEAPEREVVLSSAAG